MLEVLKGLLLDMLGELQCWAACQSSASPITSLISGVCLSPSPAGEAEEAQGEDSVSNSGSRNSIPRASTADHPTYPSPWGPSFWAVSAGQSHPDPGSRKLPVPSSPKTRKMGSCQLKQNSPTLATITRGAQGGPSGHRRGARRQSRMGLSLSRS